MNVKQKKLLIKIKTMSAKTFKLFEIYYLLEQIVY